MAATATFRIELVDLQYTCRIGGEDRALLGPLSLDLRRGEFFSIVGCGGSGKTTLLKLIAGILRPTAGSICTEGVQILPPARDFGIALQRPALLPWRNSMENILLQAELRGLSQVECRNRARRLLAWFGMAGIEAKKPHQLSLEAQCVISVCRALIHNPALLLLDEPFRMLDAVAKENILDGLQRLWGESGTSVILCTCDLQEAVLLADRVAVLSSSPSRIVEIFTISLPRPRRLNRGMTTQIAEYCTQVRMSMRSGGILP